MDPFSGMDDHDLLAGGVADTWLANKANGRRWARLVEFHRRREASYAVHERSEQKFLLTARQETVVEVGELWAMSEGWLRSQLNIALFLCERLPGVWELCLSGQLDGYRAMLVADLIRDQNLGAGDLRTLDARVTAFLRKHLRATPGVVDDQGREVPAMVACTPRQLRNKLNYELRKLRPADAEERHRKALADRAVRGRDLEDGMGHLGITATVDQVRLAERRLSLAARAQRAAGDERTLDQLRSDLAMGLLTGTGSEVPLPAYARPVINVTVPIQTLMGISDEPGELSGGTVIPAGLARAIAQRPGSTWHRMLTDPAGHQVELSTKSYQPTAPIWRSVVAQWGSCFRPGCDRPAVECEADHRVAWPQGPTSSTNLWPGCKSDHKAKHTPGFSIEEAADGSFTLCTRAGFAHRIDPDTRPASDQWPEVETGIHHSADEILRALQLIRLWREEDQADPLRLAGDRELLWECDAPDWDPADDLRLLPEAAA